MMVRALQDFEKVNSKSRTRVAEHDDFGFGPGHERLHVLLVLPDGLLHFLGRIQRFTAVHSNHDTNNNVSFDRLNTVFWQIELFISTNLAAAIVSR